MRRFILASLLLIGTVDVYAQERNLLRKGNELYTQKKYPEAAATYQQAIKKQPQSVTGHFNLGNALIQQKQYDAARKTFSEAAKDAKDPVVQSGARYNTGNTFMSQQEWQQAVDAYKQALRKKPGDPDAQYNLSYALAKLKQQQQDQQQQKQNKKQDQQKKDQQKPKDDKKENQDQQPKDGEQQEQKRPQPQPSKLSEKQAENLLKALQQDERRTQDKMQQSKAVPAKLDKDW